MPAPPLSTLTSVLSCLLRLTAWIFLRLAPVRYFRYAIPALFASYLSSFTLGELTKEGDTTLEPATPATVVVAETEVLLPVGGDGEREAEAEEGEVVEGKEDGTAEERAMKELEVAAAEKRVEVVKEDIIVAVEPSRTYSHPLTTLALTLPSASFPFRLTNLLINLAIFAFSMDFLLTPFFQPFPELTYSRVGAVTHDSAKLVLRYPLPPPPDPPSSDAEDVVFARESQDVRAWWREKMTEGEWVEGPVVPLAEENDWVGVVKLESLLPSTEYEYRFAFPNSTVLPTPSKSLSFRTFPDPRLATGANFKFVASSCLMPNFPYVPSLTRNPRLKGFDMLAEQLFPASASPESASSVEPQESKPIPPIASAPSPSPVEEADAEPPSPPTESDADAIPETAQEPLVSATQTPAPRPSVRRPLSLLFTWPGVGVVPGEETKPDAPSPPAEPESGAEEAAGPGPATPTPAPAKSLWNPVKSFFNRRPAPVLPPSDAKTEFMILLGDFIYADVPMYVGDTAEGYRRLYRRNYASDSYKKVYEKLPTLHIYDDHEIANNYIGNANDTQAPFPSASNAYGIYQHQANHDPIRPGQHYYEFQYADSAFFVLDCRKYRRGPEQDAGAKATMLGEEQMADLLAWLGKVNSTATFKFIVSSVPFTTLWGGIDGHTDTWAGYWTERHALLQRLGSVPNVFIISGDRHEFAAVSATPPPPGNSVLELSTSPMNAFYVPFARTFDTKAKKSEKWARKVEKTVVGEDGKERVVTETEMVPEEQVLKYLPDGNYKWSTFEVDTRDPEHPKLIVDVSVEGRVVWRLNVMGKPVHLTPPTTAVASNIGQGVKNVFNALGLGKALGL